MTSKQASLGTSAMTTTFSSFARNLGSMRDKGRSRSRQRMGDSQIFSLDDNRKKLTKDEVEKVKEIKHRWAQLGRPDIPEPRIEYALRSHSAQGNVEQAMAMLYLYNESVSGIIKPYDPTIKMLGAENREKSTCWLDSLLFAMFARSDVFQAVLTQHYEEEDRRKLVEAIRLWVNMLRSGLLITTDITSHLQIAIAECGWADAGQCRQQDASEAFNFITDKLRLPLLTLKTDIYHQGKEDANDDHKFITERMLDVAIPDDLPERQSTTLELLLEDYFNNRVEVKRHLARSGTTSLGTMNDTDEKETTNVETVEVVSSRDNSPAPVPAENSAPKPPPQRPNTLRMRAASIFSDRKTVTVGNQTEGAISKEEEATGGRKEVLMPAWQFLNLIPWYTANVPHNPTEERSAFHDKNLMLGITIKRYGMKKDGSPFRRSTHIDVPLEMASPHFTTGEDMVPSGLQTEGFKLVLVAFVCHRGSTVDGGHYISFVRAEVKCLDEHESFAGPEGERLQDQSHDAWLRFDDLASERVTTVDVKTALEQESPYMLFYQVKPIDDESPDDMPPPYQESNAPMEILAEKLAVLQNEGRQSAEQFTRPSVEVSRVADSPASAAESRGRPSQPDSRRRSMATTSMAVHSDNDSVQTLATDHLVATEAVSSASTRAASPSLSRPHTYSERTGSDDSSAKRFSVSMPRFRLPILVKDKEKEKMAQTEVVVSEIPLPLPLETPAVRPPSSEQSVVVEEETPQKITEKKKLFGGRRGSNYKEGTGKSSKQKAVKEKKPDRDCMVM